MIREYFSLSATFGFQCAIVVDQPVNARKGPNVADREEHTIMLILGILSAGRGKDAQSDKLSAQSKLPGFTCFYFQDSAANPSAHDRSYQISSEIHM
jgi:hypothetical protein